MKISEYRGEDALDLLADILEPMAHILSDKKIWAIAEKDNYLAGVKYAIKNYKHDIIEILATLDGVPAEEYQVNFFTLPTKVMDIVNDEMMRNFFRSQFQKEEETSFGTVTEHTKGAGKK